MTPILFSLNATGQLVQTVINYETWTGASGCNIFASSTNVPATIGSTNTNIAHLSLLGQPTYDASNDAVSLTCNAEVDPQGNTTDFKGTEYRIAYTFKQNYIYTITINAACINNSGSNASIRLFPNGGVTGTSNQCNGPASINPILSGGLIQSFSVTGGATWADYSLTWSSFASQQPFLNVAAIPPIGSGSQTILIRKITIVETPPTTAFTLSPSSLSLSCGSTTPITFTATGSNIPNGATVTYTWNLGATPNGWLHNGSPALQSISTGTTNTLTLTPDCGTTQSSVSATVSVNNTNYNTNTSNVSVTAPSLTIQGNTSLCSGTSNYCLIGTIPCNAVVTWSATPSGIISLSPNGSCVTVTQVGDGIATLKATINACNNFSVSHSIAVGLPDRPKVLDEMGEEITTVSTCTYTYKSLCPTVDSKWDILEWEWEKVVGSFNLIDFESCADILGYEASSGFISVRVRNACGWSNPTFIAVNVNDCNRMSTEQKSVKVFPNPATNFVTLSIDKKQISLSKTKGKETAQAGSINDVKIYDNFGTLRLYRKFKNEQKATLDVSKLPNGIYRIEVNLGSGIEYQQLIIQR